MKKASEQTAEYKAAKAGSDALLKAMLQYYEKYGKRPTK